MKISRIINFRCFVNSSILGSKAKLIPIIATCLTLLAGCSSTVMTPPNLKNKNFPKIEGKNLNGDKVIVPDNYLGKPTVVLVGYQQKAQFDIDRWILGLLQADVSVQIVELPTIPGMMPQAVQSFIDNGMRSGIPKEDWASVVTIYEDASKVIEAIGNERPQSAHVLLLNKDGQIIWDSNRGYSAEQILELKSIVNSGALVDQ